MPRSSRTVGLPAATGDIGNWLEPVGLASLFVEATVVLLIAQCSDGAPIAIPPSGQAVVPRSEYRWRGDR